MIKLPFVLAVIAGLAANAPLTPIPSRPPTKNNAIHAQQPQDAQDNSVQAQTRPVAGSSKVSPLYVQAECEHGCGYTEHESFWARLVSDPNAIFALAVAIFTLGLVGTTAWTNIIALKQIRLSRAEFIASRRPKLRVRKVRIDRPVEGNQITVRYEVINVGETRARILDNEVTIRIAHMPAAARRYAGIGPEVTGIRQFHFADEVQAGEALPASSEILRFEPEWGFDAGWWWAGRLYVIGVIRYIDDNGVTRRTGFYRQATRDLNRFVLADIGPDAMADHEYED